MRHLVLTNKQEIEKSRANEAIFTVRNHVDLKNISMYTPYHITYLHRIAHRIEFIASNLQEKKEKPLRQ